MALDFPNAPTVGQLFPASPAPGTPQWQWNGTLWTAAGVGGYTGTVRYDVAQTLLDAQKFQARQNIYAAPFDAMASANLIINGGMEISQEIGSGAINIANSSSVTVVDQFMAARAHAAATAVISANQGVGGAPIGWYFVQMLASTAMTPIGANDYAMLATFIEGTRIGRLFFGTSGGGGLFCVLGFWVYSSTV